jgi:cell division protein FtsB
LAAGQLLSVALGLVIVLVTLSALVGEHGVAHLVRLRGEQRELGRATFARLERNARLRTEIQRLRSDERYLEALARRQLGLVKPNETVYRFRRPD